MSSTEAFEVPDRFPTVAGLEQIHSGKVRDTYAVGEASLLIVASDRISAFDVVLPTGVSYKGRVLTMMSAFWFAETAGLIANHLISTDWAEIADLTGIDADQKHLAGRSSLVKRAARLDVECVMRGYLAGSGWSEYKNYGTLAEVRLPAGLIESQKLPEPAFTPAIKNDAGHDQNISVDRLRDLIGADLAWQVEEASRAVFTHASAVAAKRGILVADTKFEFGLIDGRLLLIDELLTPDSSRFWDAGTYRPGGAQPSFDKQPVRDYLDASGWNRQAPAPALPQDIARATTERYLSAYRRVTGQELNV
jgi:phosphoribosylaminoimidazole-succinocarboxamide synthase